MKPPPEDLPPSTQRSGWKLRLLLPPNLASAATRDAIVVKVEFVSPDKQVLPPEKARFGSGGGFQPAHQKGAAALKAACGGNWSGIAQLRRRALREVLAALAGTDVVAFVNRPAEPLVWTGETLPGVSEHLADPVKPAPAAAAPAAAQAPISAFTGRGIAAARANPAAPAPRSSVPAPAVRAPAPGTRHATPLVDGSRHFLSVQAEGGSLDPFHPELLEFLKQNHFTWETSNRRWWLRDERKVLNLLGSHRSTLSQVHGAVFTPNFEKNLGAVRTAEIVVETRPEGSSFEVETRIVAGDAPADAIARAVAEGKDFVEDAGAIYLLPKVGLEKLRAARQALGGDGSATPVSRQRVRSCDLVSAQEALEAASPDFKPPAAWLARSEALRNLSRLEAPPLPPALETTLRLYQKIGTAWLRHLDRSGLGGILADEMGLGKTLQALALLWGIHKADTQPADRRPSLVVAPAGLVENWRREAAKFTPDLRVVTHQGLDRARDTEFAGADLVVTSYTTLARDAELFLGSHWRCVLADEAQHVKNRRTQNARALAGLRTGTRLLLTGTPVENSIDDLVSLFSFLMPGFLQASTPGLDAASRAVAQQSLLRKAAPYILRRTKAAVAPELPARIEQVVTCRLGAAERAAYEALRRRCDEELGALEDKGAGENAVRLAALTHLLRLRQFCCDPRLLPEGTVPRAETLASAKLEAFAEVLDEAVDGGHRVLVFSQFTSQLALLRTELEERGLPCLYLDGSTQDRPALCEKFNNDPSIPVFLISLKAGGTGLNLTGADTVVHYDPWWNPAVEAQATDRAHRIGQKRVVTSLKLVVEDTVEDKVLELQRTKRQLLDGLLDEAAATTSLTLTDLRGLLR